jgi:disulfide bond formation protein DsbB
VLARLASTLKLRVKSPLYFNISHHWMTPFVIAATEILLDYLFTGMGLSLEIRELHPNYHPVWAGVVFSVALTVLTFTLPRDRWGRLCILGIASCSYVGAINNALVLLGIFPGFH